MNKPFLFTAVPLFFLNISAGNLDMRYYELTYAYKGSFTGDSLRAVITCRPIKDTLINGIGVLKYRFIKVAKDSSDTTFDYLHITDTSVVNYAYRGTTPNILLKRSATEDSLVVEATPYTTFACSYASHAQWLTRPDTTDLYSIKEYVGQEDVTVTAGSFFCNKVHADMFVTFCLADFYSDQWSIGNTVVKSDISEGVHDITDSMGTVIGSYSAWESFELISFSYIGSAVSDRKGISTKTILPERDGNGRPKFVSLNGRSVKSGTLSGRGILVNTVNKRRSIHIIQR